VGFVSLQFQLRCYGGFMVCDVCLVDIWMCGGLTEQCLVLWDFGVDKMLRLSTTKMVLR
jgi:hypothetical protein